MRSSIVLLLLIVPVHTSAQVLPVKVKDSSGSEAIGFVVNRQSKCVIVTAAHLVVDRVDVSILQASRAFEASILWNDSKTVAPSDVAILAPRVDLGVPCKSLPDTTIMEESLAQPIGQLWTLGLQGEMLTPRVTITKRDVGTLTLTVLDEPERYVVGGVSGAAVTFDGKIVAVVSGNNGRNLIAERLDSMIRRGGTGLAASEARVEERFQPFDLSKIPEMYAEPARKARSVREDSERLRSLVRDVEKLADEASSFANNIPLGEASQGHGRFSTTDGNFYSGQVTKTTTNNLSSVQSTISGRGGIGILRMQLGDNKGRVIKCYRDANDECKGPGVIEWPSNVKWKRGEFEFVKGLIRGPSFLLANAGDTCYGVVESESDGSWRFVGYGVSTESDGRRFEGQIGPSCLWNGYGVLWNSAGSLIRAGRWDNGQVVEK